MTPAVEPTTTPCAQCGAPIDPRTAAYTARGLVCRGCEARETSATAYQSPGFGGFGPLGWSLLSLVCNPFMLFSILGIVGGFKELSSLKSLGREYVGAAYEGARIKAIFAIVVGFLQPAIVLGVFGLAVLVAALSPSSRYDSYYDDPYYPSYNDPYYPSSYDDPYYESDYGSGYGSEPSYGAPSYGTPSYGTEPGYVDPSYVDPRQGAAGEGAPREGAFGVAPRAIEPRAIEPSAIEPRSR
jgi:hypothetical protein